MSSRKVFLALVVLMLLAAAALVVLRPGMGRDSASPGAGVPRERAGAGDVHKSGAPANPVATVLDRLRDKPERDDALQVLRNLRSELLALPKDQAVAWIRDFLVSGGDGVTGLSYEIGDEGMLKEWPSLRSFLLDMILVIDPAAAASISREILAQPSTADEWSLALRNVAKVENTPDSKEFLRERTEALIANAEWQAAPSVGYLNAFDVLVHVEATASTPLLSALIQRKDRRDLAHAGFLALDRLVQRRPREMLELLAADGALHADRPEMVAQEFARADLRDPAQQTIVRAWLLDPARTSAELRSFAGVYPNANHFVSRNLLTTELTPSGAELAAHDLEALAVVTGWQSDPAFASVADCLATMKERLAGFTGSREARGGSGDPPR